MNTIYCFSATGNSLAAAKEIAKNIDAQVLPMNDASCIPTDASVIGFVFPVYAWGMPNQVERFISRLEIEHPSPYLFGVATCGVLGKNAIADLARLLSRKGHTLDYGKVLRSVANNIFLYDIDLDRASRRLDRCDSDLRQVVCDIFAQSRSRLPKGDPVSHWLHSKTTGYSELDRRFTVHDSCTGCGICAKLCPAGNISMQDGRPVFSHQCEHCIACVQWCPRQAIDWDGRTQNRTRYHNPGVSLEEMIAFQQETIAQ